MSPEVRERARQYDRDNYRNNPKRREACLARSRVQRLQNKENPDEAYRQHMREYMRAYRARQKAVNFPQGVDRRTDIVSASNDFVSIGGA